MPAAAVGGVATMSDDQAVPYHPPGSCDACAEPPDLSMLRTDDQAVPLPPGAVEPFDAVREASFTEFWGHVGPWIAGGHADPEDVAHEAHGAGYGAGYEAGRAQGAATEREACAKVVEQAGETGYYGSAAWNWARHVAGLIRARTAP